MAPRPAQLASPPSAESPMRLRVVEEELCDAEASGASGGDSLAHPRVARPTPPQPERACEQRVLVNRTTGGGSKRQLL